MRKIYICITELVVFYRDTLHLYYFILTKNNSAYFFSIFHPIFSLSLSSLLNYYFFSIFKLYHLLFLKCSKVKEFVTLCTMNRDLLILSEQ